MNHALRHSVLREPKFFNTLIVLRSLGNDRRPKLALWFTITCSAHLALHRRTAEQVNQIEDASLRAQRQVQIYREGLLSYHWLAYTRFLNQRALKGATRRLVPARVNRMCRVGG